MVYILILSYAYFVELGTDVYKECNDINVLLAGFCNNFKQKNTSTVWIQPKQCLISDQQCFWPFINIDDDKTKRHKLLIMWNIMGIIHASIFELNRVGGGGGGYRRLNIASTKRIYYYPSVA